jgi:hypothetical protein
MTQTEYKSKFTGWRQITPETAKDWAKFMFKAIATKTHEEAVNIINSRLRGISFTKEELK